MDNGVLYFRDALEDIVHHLCTFEGIFAGLFEQNLHFEEDEVGGVLRQVLQKFAVAVFFGKRVGVLAVGQQAHTHVHPFFEQHIDAAQGGLDAGGVTVVQHCDVLGQRVEHLHLAVGQGGAG